MIKVTPPATRDETLAHLTKIANDNPEFTHMILPSGMISDLPSKIGHMKVSESDHIERNKFILTIDIELKPF